MVKQTYSNKNTKYTKYTVCVAALHVFVIQEMEECKDILLSGGLSENKYLRSILKARFGNDYNVLEIPRPILAVVEKSIFKRI